MMFRSAMLTLALAAGAVLPLAATAAPAEAAVRIVIPAPVVVVGGPSRADYDRRERERREHERLEAIRLERLRREAALERRIAYEHAAAHRYHEPVHHFEAVGYRPGDARFDRHHR